jgi:cell division protein FtsI (penicillin-binding protein 3)
MSRPVSLNDNPLLKMALAGNRSQMLMLIMALSFLGLAGRAAYLQVFTNEYLQKEGASRYSRTLEMPASRGKILDRHGVILASSLPAKAIWAVPDQIEATTAQVAQLAKLLDIPLTDLKKKLADEDRNFVYLKRQVEPEVSAKIAAMELAGIYQKKEYKRHYPEGESAAHVVGFTNVEDRGQEGFELSQERSLAGKVGSRRVIKDRLGRVIESEDGLDEPHDGKDLTLSIDSKVQYLAFAAVRDAVKEHKAKAGAAVVLDTLTGEVLALANWPTYNPNARAQLTGAQLRNRVITDTFEPGSTMKPFIAGMAVESGKFSPKTQIQTAPGKLTIGSATISDAHPHGLLTVEQIIQKSSNVGTVHMAMKFDRQQMWDLYSHLGFGQAPQMGFPGAVAGRLRPHKNWRPIEQATMSYGHGVSVSLIQMARAYSVFARDGDLIPVSMLKTDAQAAGVQVFKPETARAVRKMLEMAAGPEGTAPKAQIRDYRVAGKTGTAHKQEDGKYVNKYVSSFVGLAPASNPRLVVAVMIDEPSAGKYYAGDVAAPLFSKLTGDALRALRVAPDSPGANLVIPTEPVKESL